jgi:hypothetical protein
MYRERERNCNVRPQDESQLTDQRRRYSVDKRDPLLLLRPIEGCAGGSRGLRGGDQERVGGRKVGVAFVWCNGAQAPS